MTGLTVSEQIRPQVHEAPASGGSTSAQFREVSVSDRNSWLSILIPVYNVGSYLEECLQSMTRQLEPGIEIVAVNDASTDDGAAILSRYLESPGSALRVVTLDLNKGVAAARNRLVQEARGDYCWFVDADDLMCPGAIHSLRRIIESDAPDLVMCDFRVHRQHFGLKHQLRGESHRRSFSGPSRKCSADRSSLVRGIMGGGQFHPWSKIAKRSIWAKVRFPQGSYFEDIAVFAQLTEAVHSFIHVPEVWVAYRQRQGSILYDITPAKMRDQLSALNELGAVLELVHTEPTDDVRFSLQSFLLRSHASLARRIAKDSSVERDALRSDVCESLLRCFPDGTDAILAAYRRRGWFLRAWRARHSLQSVGLR